MKKAIYIFLMLAVIAGCKSDSTSTTDTKPVSVQPIKVPPFSGDEAYKLIEKQLSFGHRVPGTKEHEACKDWMVEELKSMGATVEVQEFDASYYSGETVKAYNIIAQFNPEHKKRVFVSAHWDSRRVADQDPDESKRDQPILGADDGGSGVAVAMQIGRTIQANPIDMGVDIVLFDVEDQGSNEGGRNSWCLGSQYWSRNLVPRNYKPEYGILLDMVGSKNARFAKDRVSARYAAPVQDKIWRLAKNMGYSNLFIDQAGLELTDDHYFVNVIAGIPTIDIINQSTTGRSGFGEYWHTHDDNIDIIDKRTLRITGQVVTAALYRESAGQLK